MEGVIVFIVIGLVLFTPIGFYAGYYQHQKDLKKEMEEQNNMDDILNQN